MTRSAAKYYLLAGLVIAGPLFYSVAMAVDLDDEVQRLATLDLKILENRLVRKSQLLGISTDVDAQIGEVERRGLVSHI